MINISLYEPADFMRILLIILLFTVIASAYSKVISKRKHSNVKSDEHVILFNTSGWLNEQSQQWHIPIHGWIYEPELSHIRKALVATTLKKKYQLSVTPETEKNFSDRTNLLFADNERGKRIIIDIAGSHHTLQQSAANGHFYGDIMIDKKIIDNALTEQNSSHDPTNIHAPTIRYTVVLKDADKRHFTGQSALLVPNGLSVISDIDDTVKISHVTDKKELIKATFFDDFAPVSGMKEVYRNLSQRRASFHFVSSSPWQLYTPLEQLMSEARFPWADFSLKYIRFKDSTLLNLFKPGLETKPAQISAVIDNYPKRHFLLVGDSGEQDPEAYALIIERYPTQIKGVYIRNITDEVITNQRFAPLIKQSNIPWQLFTEASEIEYQGP